LIKGKTKLTTAMIVFILKLIGIFLFLNLVVYVITEIIEEHNDTGLGVFGEKIHEVSEFIVKCIFIVLIVLMVVGLIIAVVMAIWAF